MTNEEYIELTLELLKRIKSNSMLKRIYSYVNKVIVGRWI